MYKHTANMVRAVQNGETPVAAVIQNTPGMMGVTHYHSPACADVKREMKRGGQSKSDVLYATFSTIADILEFEYGNIASDENESDTPEWWASVMENSYGMVRIMPCLSIPAGRVGDSPLIAHDNFFRAGFDIPEIPETVENNSVEWHVSVNGEWLSVQYDGYAPVNVECPDGRTRAVQYRHLATTCLKADKGDATCPLHPAYVPPVAETPAVELPAPVATSIVKVGTFIGVVTGETCQDAEHGTLFAFTVSGGEFPLMWTAVKGAWSYVMEAQTTR